MNNERNSVSLERRSSVIDNITIAWRCDVLMMMQDASSNGRVHTSELFIEVWLKPTVRSRLELFLRNESRQLVLLVTNEVLHIVPSQTLFAPSLRPVEFLIWTSPAWNVSIHLPNFWNLILIFNWFVWYFGKFLAKIKN